MSLRCLAVTPQSLSDSLNDYVLQYAHIDPIKVSNIRQNGLNVVVYTNSSLSQLSLDADELQDIKRHISIWLRGDEKAMVSIYSDKHELSELITSRYRKRTGKKWNPVISEHPLSKNSSRCYNTDNGLEGRHIALWASHGMYYNQDEMIWRWQRAKLWTTVEDLFTSGFTMPYLVPMLENAGAVVIQPRERDIQTEEVIVKADGYTFRPHIRKAGDYAVYVRYNYYSHNTRQAVYNIYHTGQTTSFLVNQQMSAGVWVYLGNFYFSTDTTHNYISLEEEGKDGLPADAFEIRLGGGMGSIVRYPYSDNPQEQDRLASLATKSGYPRFMEGTRYWLQYNGYPDSIYCYSEGKNDYKDDLAARGRWVNYLAGGSSVLPDKQGLNVPVCLSLAIHSDAGVTYDSTTIGTLAIYSEKDDDKRTSFLNGATRLINRDLADKVQTQIVEDVRSAFNTQWSRRGLKNASYSEVRLPLVPSVLVEMLSHQNFRDMQLGLNPEFKFIVSRAVYKGILQFIHEQDNTPYIVQPLPVKSFGMELTGSDSLTLMWKANIDTIEPTAVPDYYVLYTRKDGEDWDNGIRIRAERGRNIIRYSKPLIKDVRMDFRVAAGNRGGISLMSETLSAYIGSDSRYTALVINGFSRTAAPEMADIDSLTGGILPGSYAIPYYKDVTYIGDQYDYNRQHQWLNDDECGFGMSYSDYAGVITVGNTFDYPLKYSGVLSKNKFSYVSMSESMVSGETGKYDLVVLIKGKQKYDNEFYPAAVRTYLSSHLNRGGKLLLSGSYIASGLVTKDDRAFASQNLYYKFYSTHASKTGRLFVMSESCYDFATTPNDSVICCESPDGIVPVGTARRIARYGDTGVCAGTAYKNSIVVLPFMLESVADFDSLADRCIGYLFSPQ